MHYSVRKSNRMELIIYDECWLWELYHKVMAVADNLVYNFESIVKQLIAIGATP